MYFMCCVRNCSSTRKDAMLHKFPCNENRLLKWIQCLKDDNINISSIHNLFVCQKHFERRFVRENSRLLYDAYPTLFTPAEITTGVPECKENVDPKVDHSYSRKRHIDHTYAKDLPPTSSSGACRIVLKPRLLSNTITKNKVELTIPESSAPGSCEKTCSVIPLDASHVMDSESKDPSRNILRVEVRSQSPTTDACKAKIENTIITQTPKKSGRKRIIQALNKLTPTCKLIYKEYTKAKNQADYHRRAKRAVKFAKEHSFEEMAEKMNPYAKKIFEMQINLCTKKKKGRRFTLEEKLITLAIMKQSPKCYRFLHKIFILPSSSTLNKMVSRLKIEAGINPQFFTLMKKEVDTWEDSKKYCSILFDEMALGMGLSYNSKDDKIHGFVELTGRKNKFADHVLVFMARGAVHKWQQPIAYYFCEGATSGPELKKIIKDIVSAIADIDLKPIVLGCDQGTAFQSAVRNLQEETRREQLLRNEEPDQSVIIGCSKLSVIYDPSHLIKGIRNNFLTKDIKWKGKISKWQDIVDVYKTDCSHTQSRILHKLNDEHVIPAKVKKMKVKNCVRVLSKSVAAALSYTSQFCKLPRFRSNTEYYQAKHSLLSHVPE
ncbi:uncharacterized protein LOC121740625 isoform X2 [Aricia agestis]|uniref:uncharacterized protein LOC121725554 isoform X2 n=1 Tax=Aricia agestis TaxID=91739 RepID=UPI001C20871B|nr:uncharacterized protein LOC121725554 isoform X2 [Aricia agestis]XP_041989295.1 uncharacterized protein LOC121740625 isoform X2 [Aricia agestis]